MTRLFGEVIGDPIAHSKSPLIHNFWLQKLGIDAEYRACHVQPAELKDYFDRSRKDDKWRGCNVTIPHKIEVRHHLDTISRQASLVGAVNTVYVQRARLIGENSDVDGVLEALPTDLMPPGSEVCILGTGGAARAALAACQARGIAHVLHSARDHAVARRLHEQFSLGGSVSDFDDPHNIQTADVIINATPLGMTAKPSMPQPVLDHLAGASSDAVIFDMVYAPLETELLRVAREHGLRTVDGLAMLIGQAAVAFQCFFGEPAPREHDAELRALLVT